MRILLIEDDKQLSDAVAAHLRQEGYETETCYDGVTGLYYMAEGAYDLVLLDRMLPERDGLSLLKEARQKGITSPVLMLTALGGVGDRVDGLDAGADDYLAKPFDMRELLARVRALVRRPGQIVEKEEAEYGDLKLDMTALTLIGGKGRCSLSKKEADLLGVLMKNEGQTLSRGVLFGRVWGPEAEVEEASLDSYAHFIRRRLASVSKQVSLVTVRGVGYRLEVQND